MARADKRPHDDLRQRQSQQVERISEIASEASIAEHEAKADPHSQYATDTDLTNHEGAADPHPTYLTQAEADALYDPSTLGRVWMPLTTVVSGTPELVWDDDDSLVPTEVPI